MARQLAPEWDDLACYAEAIQDYYLRFPYGPDYGPLLDCGLRQHALDFLAEASPLFTVPEALVSAGVVMRNGDARTLQNHVEDMVTNRRRGDGSPTVIGDNGCFQTINPSNRFILTSGTTRAVLRWMERVCDWGVGPDVPSAAWRVPGNRYHRKPQLALADTRTALDVFRNEREGELKVMITLQGHTRGEADERTEGVKHHLQWGNGITWGGQMRFDLRHVIRTLRRLHEDGFLERVERIHFLGTSSLGLAVCLTALKRALFGLLGRKISVSFDTSTPFLLAHKYNRAIGPTPVWATSAPRHDHAGNPVPAGRSLGIHVKQLRRDSRPEDDARFPFDTEVGRLLRMHDLRRRHGQSKAWDEVGRLLLCNSNVEALSRALIQANRMADLPDSGEEIPSRIRSARRAVSEAFTLSGAELEAHLKYSGNHLGMFAGMETEDGDVE
ncbi:hypothetical protein [Belnapia sp. F-4-1]|uniref:hypothetical protein n=1 Tax=Belnapia sp. F-4-1 TaxID=1545443 RepID=UPI0005BADA6B|nr:hypothetical protein [Belnapia sp. F-4-1]